ncbi:hypothetical protein H6P81_002393 [Aristolochia fimbriata]|uniref:TRF2/HOY1 PH-like domain-containing protein n=1 Tax=Aristolochia fimbriata TaxID=158543 RepID=A0AAV7FCI1_ARIFI|nr:hypothetical protein H6P81_002393 [Aristolochia fimbriata]
MDQKTSFNSSKLNIVDPNSRLEIGITSEENQEIKDGSCSTTPSNKMKLTSLKLKQIVDYSAEEEQSCSNAREKTPCVRPVTVKKIQVPDASTSTTPKYKSKRASNFRLSLIKIGNWEKKASQHRDLIAKFEYARHKLVWEILDDDIKKKMKIEIKWSDILSMRAIFNHYRNDVLEVELDIPPMYFVEDDVQPKKYISWNVCNDFTGDQANLFRVHHLKLGAGRLKKHYHKLLGWDNSILSVSMRPFPSSPTPYFAHKHNETPPSSPELRPTFGFTHATQSQSQNDTESLGSQTTLVKSQEALQLQYVIEPIPPPMDKTTSPQIFIHGFYYDQSILNPEARDDRACTGTFILPVTSTPFIGSFIPHSNVEQINEDQMNQISNSENFAESTTDKAPRDHLLVPNEDAEVTSTHSKFFDELEELKVHLFSDEPSSSVQPDEERVLEDMKKMANLLKQ